MVTAGGGGREDEVVRAGCSLHVTAGGGGVLRPRQGHYTQEDDEETEAAGVQGARAQRAGEYAGGERTGRGQDRQERYQVQGPGAQL